MNRNREGDSLYHYNHNHDRLGRFASSGGGGGGSAISKSVAYLRQRKEAKRRQEFLNAVQEGDTHTIYKNRKYLSDADIKSATDRARAINDLRSEKDKKTLSYFKKTADIANYVNQTISSTASAWGTLSSTFKKKEKPKITIGAKYAKSFLNKHHDLKDLPSLTADELEKESKKSKYLDELERYSKGDFGEKKNEKKSKK